MPIPPNLTPGTALDATVRPYTVTVVEADLELAPTGTGFSSTCDTTQYHALWWKVTTGPNQAILSIHVGNIGVVNYDPTVSIWTGVPPLLTQYRITTGAEPNDFCDQLEDSYFQVPVSPNTTYYIQVTDGNNTSPLGADLVLDIDDGPEAAVPAGAILISDDTSGHPAAILSPTTGAVLRYASGYPAGEIADWDPSGVICCVDGGNVSETSVIVLDSDLTTVIATHSVSPKLIRAIKSDRNGTFYVLYGANTAVGEIFTITTAGVVGGAIVPTAGVVPVMGRGAAA